jgi:hypothetical protein
MARCMMKAKSLPGCFRGEAVTKALFILNRSPTRVMDEKTPFEAWHGEAPMVHFFRTFRFIAHVNNMRRGLKKLDKWSHETIFIGYESRSKAYRWYDPVEQRIVVSCDVIFDEASMWCWQADGEVAVNDTEPFTVDYVTEVIQVLKHLPASPAQPTASVGIDDALGSPARPVAPAGMDSVEPKEIDLDANHDNAPLRFPSINEVIGEGAPPSLSRRVLHSELNFTSVEELTTFRKAEQEVPWRATMAEAMRAIQENDTWELASLPIGHRAIGLKWVYKVKRNEAVEVVRHKAHLVANGYDQRAGIDFDEVFTLVARLESVRMMVSLVAHHRWPVHHMEVKSAFLNGMLAGVVYVK